MTILINIDQKGIKSYSSNIDSFHIFSEEEREKADKINELIQERLKDYIVKVNLESIKKDKVLNYWEVGNIIRDIFFNSGLVKKEEKSLFFKNVRLHLDKKYFPADDLPRNRNIPEQFFRLAGYDKEIIKNVKWTTWSYLFDSPILSNIKSFDIWFSKKITESRVRFDQAFSRLWFQSINVLFKNVRTNDWEEELILDIIDCLFRISAELINSKIKAGDDKTKEVLKEILYERKQEFILYKSGDISKEKYQTIILEEFNKKINL